jgi:hypothetical protein
LADGTDWLALEGATPDNALVVVNDGTFVGTTGGRGGTNWLGRAATFLWTAGRGATSVRVTRGRPVPAMAGQSRTIKTKAVGNGLAKEFATSHDATIGVGCGSRVRTVAQRGHARRRRRTRSGHDGLDHGHGLEEQRQREEQFHHFLGPDLLGEENKLWFFMKPESRLRFFSSAVRYISPSWLDRVFLIPEQAKRGRS